MPKRPNAKKMAAVAYTRIKTLDSATTEGKYTVCSVKKALGNCLFLADALLEGGRVQEVQVLVRGKFKGGRNSAGYLQAGHYVLAEGPLTAKVLEVVSVVNRQAEVDALRRAGRVQEAEDEDDGGFAFDRSGEEGEQKEDIWAKEDEERMAQSEGHLSAYIARREKGIRIRAAAAERGLELAAGGGPAPLEDAEEDDAEVLAELEGGAPKAAKGEGPARREADPNSRRSRALAARLAEEAAAEGMDLFGAAAEPAVDWAALQAQLRAQEEAEAREAAEVAAWRARPVPANWEDELDIDAI